MNGQQTIPMTSLSPEHRERLVQSGIGEEVVRARGYYTEPSGAALGRLGFARSQQIVPALVIPVWGPMGRTRLSQIRPDRPRVVKGREAKYETPGGASLLLDVPPSVAAQVLDSSLPLVVTEGVLKADSAATRGIACVACLGVYGWCKDLEAWDAIPLRGRRVLVAFDSDLEAKREVRRAAARLAEFLGERGAEVEFILFRPTEEGKKVGLDDFLASGRSRDELLALAVPGLPDEPADRDDRAAGEFVRYEASEGGLFRVHRGKDGEVRRALANFDAKIVAELIEVEEPEQPRVFELEVKLNGRTHAVAIDAAEFERMGWVIPRLGAEARIEAGIGVRDEVRAAIQYVSGAIRKVHSYRRLGWLGRDDGTWVYLHAGGLVSADSQTEAAPQNRSGASDDMGKTSVAEKAGTPIPPDHRPEAEILVRNLPASLERYRLARAKDLEELVRSVRISLGFLDLAPDRITFPLYAYLWRVLLDAVRFSMFLVGPSGLGKTELSVLVVQHLGPEMDSSHVPESFASTANSLASTAHYCANAPLIVDDFVPKGSHGNIQREHEKVDQLLRGLGNQAGRNRCARDGSTLGAKVPRGGFICSGEDTPQGQSLGARYSVLEVVEGDVFDAAGPEKNDRLTEYQKLAREGWLVRATAGFLGWIAGRYEEEREQLHDQKRVFRDEVFRGCSAHPRVVDMAADLLAGIEPFLTFATYLGAIDQDRFQALWERAHHALFANIEGQEDNRIEQDPAERFLGLLASAISTGKAHLAWDPEDRDGPLDSPKLRGYKTVTRSVPIRPEGGRPDAGDEGPKFEEKEFYEPQGQQVGWWHACNLYLEPQASLEVAQLLARDAGQPPLPFGKKAMGKRLAQAGKLELSSKDRNTVKYREDGVEKDVWLVLASNFYRFFVSKFDFEMGALDEREELERRRDDRERAARDRRAKARKLREEEFIRLLDLRPAGRAEEAPPPDDAGANGTPSAAGPPLVPDPTTPTPPATPGPATCNLPPGPGAEGAGADGNQPGVGTPPPSDPASTATPPRPSGPATRTPPPRRAILRPPHRDADFLLD